jgi:hypothetical protein
VESELAMEVRTGLCLDDGHDPLLTPWAHPARPSTPPRGHADLLIFTRTQDVTRRLLAHIRGAQSIWE